MEFVDASGGGYAARRVEAFIGGKVTVRPFFDNSWAFLIARSEVTFIVLEFTMAHRDRPLKDQPLLARSLRNIAWLVAMWEDMKVLQPFVTARVRYEDMQEVMVLVFVTAKLQIIVFKL